SHWLERQSPGVGLPTMVPAGALFTPQVPAVQVWVWQAVLAPQSLAVEHWTQAPLPLQVVPPPWLQEVPCDLFGCWGVPATQVSLVHWLPSSAGTSVLSTALVVMPPLPLHWL